jgi:mycothiol system anti-sigma-R factor
MKKFMPSPCQQIHEQIAGYVDRELEPAQANTVSRHLQDCSGCAEEASVQQQMKELVREHAHPISTPARVRAEIRHRLDQEMSAFGFWDQVQQIFLRQPIPAIATIVVLMLISGVTSYFVFQRQILRETADEKFVAGIIEGEIICVDCDLLDLTNTPYVHDATHRVGLRCKDGHIWSILRSEKSQELSKNIHRHVRIDGHLFENMQYLEVREFSFI